MLTPILIGCVIAFLIGIGGTCAIGVAVQSCLVDKHKDPRRYFCAVAVCIFVIYASMAVFVLAVVLALFEVM